MSGWNGSGNRRDWRCLHRQLNRVIQIANQMAGMCEGRFQHTNGELYWDEEKGWVSRLDSDKSRDENKKENKVKGVA